MTIDGYIADIHGGLDYLEKLGQPEGEDCGYRDFMSTIDTVIMGCSTYEKILSFDIPFPHEHEMTYVLTHRPYSNMGNIHFYSGKVEELIENIRKKSGKHIYINGGADIVQQFLQADLIDEMRLFIAPRTLGMGVRLFQDVSGEFEWKLLQTKYFDFGLIELHYERIR